MTTVSAPKPLMPKLVLLPIAYVFLAPAAADVEHSTKIFFVPDHLPSPTRFQHHHHLLISLMVTKNGRLISSKILASPANSCSTLVHWHGFNVSEDSWEPASTMDHATEAIAEFHKRYPSKPKPHRSRARS